MPTERRQNERASGAIHVGMCTPLVTLPIGTSSGRRPKISTHISRLTRPWSLETPLMRSAMRRASTVMQIGPLPGCSRPNSAKLSCVKPALRSGRRSAFQHISAS